jgi:hypothetical protein
VSIVYALSPLQQFGTLAGCFHPAALQKLEAASHRHAFNLQPNSRSAKGHGYIVSAEGNVYVTTESNAQPFPLGSLRAVLHRCHTTTALQRHNLESIGSTLRLHGEPDAPLGDFMRFGEYYARCAERLSYARNLAAQLRHAASTLDISIP